MDNSEGLISAISKYLADNAGWFVAPPELAVEIAKPHQGLPASPLDAIDPNTGEVDMQRYLQPQRSLMTTIAEETRSDAVLEVSVIKVKAKVRASVASWDDMTEAVASRKSRVLSPLAGLGGNGWVYAATAEMNLWSQTGKLLWKKRRGFAVLGMQSGMGSKYRARPLTEVYVDSGAMQRWLEGTLGQLAPPLKETPAGTPRLLLNSRTSSKKPNRPAKNRSRRGIPSHPRWESGNCHFQACAISHPALTITACRGRKSTFQGHDKSGAFVSALWP